MKAYFSLPMRTYNIQLSKEECNRLIETGLLTMHVGRTECKTGRCVVTKTGTVQVLDKKDIYNDLRFNLNEPVDDIESGDYPLRFVTFRVTEY